MNELQTNIDEFNRTLSRYAEVYDPNGWFRSDVLAKKADQLGFAWSKRLDAIKPSKGSIRSERLAALKAGEGVQVRESVRRRVASRIGLRSRLDDRKQVFGRGRGRGSRLVRATGRRINFQALAVKAELNLREKGIGYSRHSARLKGLSQFAAYRSRLDLSGKLENVGRYGQLLASAGIGFDGVTLTYGSTRSEAGVALQTPEAQSALSEAVRDVTADMEVYLARKADEAAKEAGFR